MDGMPGMDELNKLKKQIEDMIGPKLKEHKKQVDDIIQLQITPQLQKNVKIEGTDCVVQLFENNVRVIFPTKDLTKKHYDNILLDESAICDSDGYTWRGKAIAFAVENEALYKYSQLPWYKKLRKWSKSKA